MTNYVLCSSLEVTVISARDVENSRKGSERKLYARVTVGDQHESTTKKTTVDKRNDTYPVWNHELIFCIDADDLEKPTGLTILIEIYLHCRVNKDRRVSRVSKTINELYLTTENNGETTRLTLPLVNHNGGGIQGDVTFDYLFGGSTPIKKLSFLKKMANHGASVVKHTVELTTLLTTGISIWIPSFCIFPKPEIITTAAGSRRQSKSDWEYKRL